jgi:chromosome partitioning protein
MKDKRVRFSPYLKQKGGRQAQMGKIIAFANQKGGVGKTTSAVNVAASLGVLGKKVLLLDLDPQGNTTSGVGISKKSLRRTVRDILTGDTPAEEVIMSTAFANLSILPANISLAGCEFDLYEAENSEFQMKTLLDPLREQYDYIIIDCPPSLGMLTVNAMAAADGVIIPMQCEFYALEGLSQLMITVSRIKQHYNPSLNITGILVTMHNSRLLLSIQVINELKKHYADKLFETTISRNVKLSEAPGFGMPVYYHDKRSKGAEEYLAVAKELMQRI